MSIHSKAKQHIRHNSTSTKSSTNISCPEVDQPQTQRKSEDSSVPPQPVLPFPFQIQFHFHFLRFSRSLLSINQINTAYKVRRDIRVGFRDRRQEWEDIASFHSTQARGRRSALHVPLPRPFRICFPFAQREKNQTVSFFEDFFLFPHCNTLMPRPVGLLKNHICPLIPNDQWGNAFTWLKVVARSSKAQERNLRSRCASWYAKNTACNVAATHSLSNGAFIFKPSAFPHFQKQLRTSQTV